MADADLAPPSVLEVADLTIRLAGTDVLAGLTFSVPAGAVLAIIGPNGSGKSVLLKALLGALPFQGGVRWAPDTRLGYVPQKLGLARDVPLTGFDLLRAQSRRAAPRTRAGIGGPGGGRLD